jgi:hypothetical protein
MTRTRQFWMICLAPDHAGARTEPKHRFTNRVDAVLAGEKLACEKQRDVLLLEPVQTIRPEGGAADLFDATNQGAI